jgi:hypothetical protein
MAWTASGIFRAFLGHALDRTNAFDMDGDSFKVALYNNSITPDRNAIPADTAFDAGQWDNANELSDPGEWDAGGEVLASPDINIGTTDVIFWSGTNLPSGSSATISGTFGCLVYDDTVTTPADQGVCFNYFGGTQSVTNGTLTLVWSANGIFRITLT